MPESEGFATNIGGLWVEVAPAGKEWMYRITAMWSRCPVCHWTPCPADQNRNSQAEERCKLFAVAIALRELGSREDARELLPHILWRPRGPVAVLSEAF